MITDITFSDMMSWSQPSDWLERPHFCTSQLAG